MKTVVPKPYFFYFQSTVLKKTLDAKDAIFPEKSKISEIPGKIMYFLTECFFFNSQPLITYYLLPNFILLPY